MKRIIIEEDDCDTVRLSEISEYKPIFAKRNGKFVGMIVHERKTDKGWILRMGGATGATGYHKTLGKCLLSCIKTCPNYEFFT